MNDLGHPNCNNVIHLHRQDRPAVERETENAPKRAHGRRRWGGRLFALGGSCAARRRPLAGGVGTTIRSSNRSWRPPSRSAISCPALRVATVEPSPGTMSVTLPGTTAAFADANIYARATGYIAKRNVDIGDHVKAGDLLAELAVPELDRPDFAERGDPRSAQVVAAAGAGQPRACAGDLGPRRAAGPRRLGDPAAGRHSTSRPCKRSEAAVAVAQTERRGPGEPAQALRQNRDYALVVAPFDGVITQRNVDVGSLVQGNATSGTFMFEIMQRT